MKEINWVQNLINWFIKEQRDMPWRKNPIPYYVWLSECMLQQTQVATVIPYFNRFITTFPTVFDLAKSDLQTVLKSWEGLGYYSRARNLHKAAKMVAEERDGIFPTTYQDLQKLPGIGPYCAAAITSIAFQNPVPVVDGNVLRVFTRFWGLYDDIKQPKTRDILFKKLEPFIVKSSPSEFNQGIMELGALICTPKNPNCSVCPINSDCYAKEQQKTLELPVKTKSKKTPHFNIGVGVIWKKNKILIAKRKEDQMLGGLWEFPGGKQKENECITTTIKREIKEETSLEVIVKSPYAIIKHAYSHFKITLHAYKCIYKEGIAKKNTSDDIKWIPIEKLNYYPFPTANKKLIKSIIEEQKTLFKI